MKHSSFPHSKSTQLDMIINACCSSREVPIILLIFERNLNSVEGFSENYSNIKFHENPSSGSRRFSRGPTDRQTDRYNEANSRLSQFFSKAPKDYCVMRRGTEKCRHFG